MKRNYLSCLLGAVIALALTLALATRGEDAPPSAPATPIADQPASPPAAEPAKPETPPPASATAETPPAPSTEAATTAPAPKAEESAKLPEAAQQSSTELRRLDTEVKPTPDDIHQEVRQTIKNAVHKHVAAPRTGNERVSIGHSTHVEKEEKADAAVSILGSTTVDGEVSDAAVSVLGNTTVNGSAGDAAVAVLGDTVVNGVVGDAAVAVGGNVTVNGQVGGEVVAVGGNVILGPNAVVKGEVVVVGGTLEQNPTAVIKGNVQRIRLPAINWVFAWARSALFKGRLLSFAPGTGWAWLVAFAALGFYLLLALIFPRGLTKCAETLEQRPGFTVLTALLMTLAMPLVFLLLAITGVGLIVIPVLGVCLFAAKILGRATMLTWLGRRFTGLLGTGPSAHAAMAVLIGGIVVMGLYLVPIVAFIVAMLIGWLGLGTVVYTLILSLRRNGAKPAPAAVAASMTSMPLPVPAVAPTAGAGEAVAGTAVPPVVPAAPAPPVFSVVALPRAGFWLRLFASFLDFILIGVAAAMIHVWPVFPLCFAAYCVVLWALRGTTIGGIICGLKVVRLDDRKVDWTVAIVRVLAGFLSLAVLGLGFIWVAFDDEKQSWHDKIAGTTIVKMPKGVSLI
jgi:uncharacterized RDD family membrane protein YckC